METAPEKTGISKAERLLLIAQTIAEATPVFFSPIGSGKGNLRANIVMSELRSRAKEAFGQDYSEQKLCGDNNLTMDFYFPDEATAVEVAGMLGAPNSEYEKDIFKCLLAQDCGTKVVSSCSL